MLKQKSLNIIDLCHWAVSIHLPLARIRPGMLPLHYNDLGLLCRELNSGLDLERVISYHWTTQEECSLRALYHRVVSINRPSGYEPDALPLRHDDELSLGGFDPPPLAH